MAMASAPLAIACAAFAMADHGFAIAFAGFANAFDLFQACFPAGTVSGAPKIRAMEIIDELESTKRGPYAGSVGYFSYNGNMDMAITIRTLIFKNGKAYLQAGAGIVADSVPEKEYRECQHKAAALFAAVDLQRVIDLRQILPFEDDVNDGTDDLVDAAGSRLLWLLLFLFRFLCDCHCAS